MDGYLSDSDTEFECVDDDRDLSYVPSSEYDDSSADINDDSSQSFKENTSPNSDETSMQKTNQNAKRNEIEFVSDLSLAPLVKTKSNSDVELWKRFGLLMKAGKLVKGLSDRFYCSLCFDNKVLKRLVLN